MSFGRWITKNPPTTTRNDLFMHCLAMSRNGCVAIDGCNGQAFSWCQSTLCLSDVHPKKSTSHKGFYILYDEP